MAGITGVIAAVLTPLDAGWQPDAAKAVAYYGQLLETGCDGLNVLGTTGEAMSLSIEQRLGLMRALSKSGLPLQRMMVGTGSASLADTATLTRAAADLGFGGALVMPPFFYRGPSDDGVLRFFEALVRRTDLAATGLYLYNFPQMSGTTFGPDLVRRIQTVAPLAGLKDSSNDLAYCADLHSRFPALNIFPSSETHLSFAKGAGLGGCISGSIALWAQTAGDLWHAPKPGESAALQRQLAAKREAVAAHPLIPAVRYLTALQQGDASWGVPIPPLQPLCEAARHSLRTPSLHEREVPL
jgi:4-hydroxy-tetrahydrodipicolinate synthase